MISSASTTVMCAAYRSPDRCGLINLNGSVVAPRPNRRRREKPNAGGKRRRERRARKAMPIRWGGGRKLAPVGLTHPERCRRLPPTLPRASQPAARRTRRATAASLKSCGRPPWLPTSRASAARPGDACRPRPQCSTPVRPCSTTERGGEALPPRAGASKLDHQGRAPFCRRPGRPGRSGRGRVRCCAR